jgi:replicative DNA helicase
MNSRDFDLDSFAENDQVFTPPNSISAEHSLIGALLTSDKFFDDLAFLSPNDFYSNVNKTIYLSILSLIKIDSRVDVITVANHLKSIGKDDLVGGISFLNDLAMNVPNWSNAVSYAKIIKEKSMLRSIASVGSEISQLAYKFGSKNNDTPDLSVADLISQAESKVLAIAENSTQSYQSKSIYDYGIDLINWVENAADNPGSTAGLSSGFAEIDEMTGGFSPGQFVVIAGRPSMGKTSFAMNIVEHVSLVKREPVLLISLEMTGEAIVQRMLGSISRVAHEKIRGGRCSDAEFSSITEDIDLICKGSLDIEERGANTVAKIRSCARRTKKKYGKLSLIVIDYLQLMHSESARNETRNEEITKISAALKALALEMSCPLIALSQLNRGVEQRPDKRPLLSDLRDSGSIEQDADAVIFLYRDEYYSKSECLTPGQAEVIFAKQRGGRTGVVQLGWDANSTRFYS